MSDYCATTSRKRHNLTLPPKVREHGEELAEEDKRSFSNLVEVLIDREWQRRQAERAKEMPRTKEAA